MVPTTVIGSMTLYWAVVVVVVTAAVVDGFGVSSVVPRGSSGCKIPVPLQQQYQNHHHHHQQQSQRRHPRQRDQQGLGFYASRAENIDNDYLWEDFKTASGEILNPYQVLKVPRTADRKEIRKSYHALSRRYHPDGVRHRAILPGSCNNLEDVREHWERINLAYGILKDDKLRKKFNRHETIADPGKAMQRAAMDAVGEGIKGIGQGIFTMGAFAIDQLGKKETKK